MAKEGRDSYVSSEKVEGMEIMKVANLMNINGASNKWGLIVGTFNEQDIEAILKLVLLNRVKEDKLVWKFNHKGNYTVRSAYRYATKTLVDNEEYQVPGEWRKMWWMKILQRIKVFIWRVLRGVLPTRMHHQDKGV